MGPSQACFCGKNTSTKRCSETDYTNGWNCQEVCGDLLPCGEHSCLQRCHSGVCGSCTLPVASTCYCGRTSKELPCDRRGEIRDSFDFAGRKSTLDESGAEEGEKSYFEGSFECGSTCGRHYDCGHHNCERGCHPQDEDPVHCPFSPDVVTSCPCGKTPLGQLLDLPRRTCQDTVPRCDKLCSKMQVCGHPCRDRCHTGACSPCLEKVQIPCRCGRTSTESICHLGGVERPECARVCRAQMNCGRHVCDKVCCAGEKRATERKRKKNAAYSPNEDFEADHICLRVCGRALKCGSHSCQKLCHKGPCASCPEAIFDEIGCACGRTVLQPPQPCGTRPPECRFDCTRARACNHPMVQHQCHPADTPCPKCPYLVEKMCVCGKQSIKNKACGLEEVHCGLPCGGRLRCGNHTCTKTCHKPGECEDADMNGSHCLQPCGKTRTSCNHSCIDQCHTPFACKEEKPCQSRAISTCDCQNRKQEVRCGASSSNPYLKPKHLECDDECKRLQRNARLAQAFKIDPATHTDNHIPYSDETMRFFLDNINWAQTQEREFRVFANDPAQKRYNFKPMHNAQRAFIHTLAEDYGLDSQSQDPEPLRHVSLFKTPRFVSAPYKTLHQALKIMKTALPPTPAVSAPAPSPAGVGAAALFNAFLLSSPRFGLTIDDVDKALAAELKSAVGSALTFTTTFLASDEVVIEAAPPSTAASIARAGAAVSPAGIERTLKMLKPAIQRAARAAELSTNTGSNSVTLSHVDAGRRIVRREGDGSSGAAGPGGWSAVVSRAAEKPAWGSGGAMPGPETRPSSSFVALRKPVMAMKKKELVAKQPDGDVASEQGGERSAGEAAASPAADVAP